MSGSNRAVSAGSMAAVINRAELEETDARKKRRRRPILSPIAWELSCPECLEPLAEPKKGSQMWTGEDFRGGEIQCDRGQVVRLPSPTQNPTVPATTGEDFFTSERRVG